MSLKDKIVGYFYDEELSASSLSIFCMENSGLVCKFFWHINGSAPNYCTFIFFEIVVLHHLCCLAPSATRPY